MSSAKEQAISKSVNDIYLIVNSIVTDNKLSNARMGNIEKGIENIQATLQRDYVTQDQLALTKAELARIGKILYFAISMFAGAVILAIANLVIQRP